MRLGVQDDPWMAVAAAVVWRMEDEPKPYGGGRGPPAVDLWEAAFGIPSFLPPSLRCLRCGAAQCKIARGPGTYAYSELHSLQ